MSDKMTPTNERVEAIDYKNLDCGDFLKAVGTDAYKWADAFMQLWGAKLSEVDHGLMIGWFANAIMAQYDESRKAHEALKAENERLRARLEAAEDFIDKSPCDPDITERQCAAYTKWQALKGSA